MLDRLSDGLPNDRREGHSLAVGDGLQRRAVSLAEPKTKTRCAIRELWWLN